ncbi:MAG: efflux RND transporter permease subunit, partial [Gemmatimonadota bacterium]
MSRWLTPFEAGFARVAAAYERALARALDRPRSVLSWTTGAFAVALVLAFLLPRDVLPEVDQRAFTARLTLSPGSPIERTEALALRLDGWLRDQPEVEAVMARVGQASAAEAARAAERGSHTAVLDVRLESGGDPTREVMARLRRAFDNLPPGALALETGAATELGAVLGTAEADLAVEVRGEDRETLGLVAGDVEQRLAALPMLADVSAGLEAAHPEIRISLDRGAIARHGLEVERVVSALTDRTRGRIATRFVDFDRRVPVVVRAGEEDRRDLERILDGSVDDVPLRLLIDVEETVGPTAIRRENQERVVPVTADVVEGGLSGAIETVEEALRGVDLPDGARLEVGGGGEELRRSFRGLGFAFVLALLLIYMILAAQFESLVLPFVILLAVPLSLIGAILLLTLAGSGLNTMSLIGIVVLAGIAVNNAIVKVDFIQQARAAGLPVRAAIEEAGRARLRPIVMTSVTTILGLLPMAIGLGSGAELRSPLAIAVIGGMITSTAL